MHIDNKDKDILILSEGTTQGLDDITKYPINFTQPRKWFVLSLHYNGSHSFLFVNATKIYQFKTRDLEMKDYALYFVIFQKILQSITWKRIFCWFESYCH